MWYIFKAFHQHAYVLSEFKYLPNTVKSCAIEGKATELICLQKASTGINRHFKNLKPLLLFNWKETLYYYTPGRGKIVPRNYTPGRGKIVPRNVM